jgi:hypothetical protein
MPETLTLNDLLLELTREKIDIETLVDEVDAHDLFDEDDERGALRKWKKSLVRRAIKQLKDEDGVPRIWSVTDVGPDGREIHKYKQESLFNVDEYKQAIEYCRGRGNYWRRIERHLVRNAREKFGEETLLF